ncbi:hypothetical protein GCM10023322_14320 [Rugosimonospora acidiphila]|uniref:Cytochrome P450 n=1 Tax=Rugosimonospora acidiphila TaxID=556531 RepID=A0ABP9RNA0_9ACTN
MRRYADVEAALADPRLVPPPAAAPGPTGGVAWLRATVARFSHGQTHDRRRALVVADLARLDPAALRRAAAGDPDTDPRRVAVRTLAQALGLADPDAVAEAIGVVAGAYFGDAADPAADRAVARLLPLMLPTGPTGHDGFDGGVAAGAPAPPGATEAARAAAEVAANRIGLLVQACDATATLVDHARRAAVGCPAATGVEALLAETLRHDPPVPALHRVATAATRVADANLAPGERVVLDVAAANRDPAVFADPDVFDPRRPGPASLTFGAAPRACPGTEHALAIAAGVLDRYLDAPATLVTGLVEQVLTRAGTWTAWDGRPRPAGDRVYTPHKAIRRVADHLVDHLAEIEARLAGQAPPPDHWHASMVTTPADLAPFTAHDLDEARSRLSRLALIWARRLDDLTAEQLDRSPGPGWSFRQLAFHLAGSVFYADAVGDLTPTDAAAPKG